MRSETVTRILKKAGILSPGAHGFDSYFVRSGKLFGQNISFHPWKNREYAANELCPCSPEEEALFVRLSAADRAELEAERKEFEASVADRAAWIQTLPSVVDGLIVNKRNGTLEDEYGNYYLTLPSSPVADLAAWVVENSHDPE